MTEPITNTEGPVCPNCGATFRLYDTPKDRDLCRFICGACNHWVKVIRETVTYYKSYDEGISD